MGPGSSGDGKGFKESHREMLRSAGLCTNLASFDIIGDIGGQRWPLETLSNHGIGVVDAGLT